MIPAVHPFSAESGPHEIRGPVIIDVNWRNIPNIIVVLPSHMRASATNTTIQTPSINIGCPTLSDEGVCNWHLNLISWNWVVLPSQMRASATLIMISKQHFLSCPTLSDEGVCNKYLIIIDAARECCPTLSDEGVCNQLKINISESWTFYLVCSNYLKYNPHMTLSWKLRKYTEKYINIMTDFHVFPHFNSPQPNLNLRKWIKDIQWNTHSRKMFKHPRWISDNYKSVYMISSQLFSHNQDNMSFATVTDTLRYW